MTHYDRAPLIRHIEDTLPPLVDYRCQLRHTRAPYGVQTGRFHGLICCRHIEVTLPEDTAIRHYRCRAASEIRHAMSWLAAAAAAVGCQ